MKKNLGVTGGIFPMPVLMIATYNSDGTVDVMNAAWGTMHEGSAVAINLSASHKTFENIKANKAFTVSFADAEHMVEADYVGMVSANNEPDKFAKSGLTATKSDFVNAPIINEFPICMECEFVEYLNDSYVIGKVVNVCADEKVMKDGKVDISLVNAISYDSFTHGYYKVTERVGNAFSDGAKLK